MAISQKRWEIQPSLLLITNRKWYMPCQIRWKSDIGWPWRPLRAIVAKRCEIGPKLLLITNRKSHIGFQMTWKSFTLNDLEAQYCNRNCIGCSLFPPSKAFLLWEIIAKPASDIFLVPLLCSCLYHLVRWPTVHVHGTVAVYIAWRNDHVWCLSY